jgi:hypothetical protein
VRPFERVDNSRQRLEKRGVIEADFVGKRKQRRRRHDNEFSKRTVDRQPDVVPVLAEVVVASGAVKTRAASGDRLDRDPGPRRGACRVRPELDDFAGCFVPGDQRVRHQPVSPAIDVVVHEQIGPAKARPQNANERLAGRRHGRRHVHDREVADARDRLD